MYFTKIYQSKNRARVGYCFNITKTLKFCQKISHVHEFLIWLLVLSKSLTLGKYWNILLIKLFCLTSMILTTFPNAAMDSFIVSIKETLSLSSSFFLASAIDSRTKTSSSPRSSSASSEIRNYFYQLIHGLQTPNKGFFNNILNVLADLSR